MGFLSLIELTSMIFGSSRVWSESPDALWEQCSFHKELELLVMDRKGKCLHWDLAISGALQLEEESCSTTCVKHHLVCFICLYRWLGFNLWEGMSNSSMTTRSVWAFHHAPTSYRDLCVMTWRWRISHFSVRNWVGCPPMLVAAVEAKMTSRTGAGFCLI